MSLNVLLVDDSAIVRDIVGKSLGLSEVPLREVFQAGNGREALDVLDKNWIDLVFCDINMPVMDGVELVERMARDDLLKTVPVVIISSQGSAERIEYLRSKGVRAYLRKPFTPEQIREVVFDVMGWGDGKGS
jgi:two-component system chemotaxis response regulator CheY